MVTENIWMSLAKWAQRPEQARMQRLQSLGINLGRAIEWDSSSHTRKCLDQREFPETSLVSETERVGGKEFSHEVSPGQERMRLNLQAGEKGGRGMNLT